jgi:DNA-binding MarR family transcriptional regulator
MDHRSQALTVLLTAAERALEAAVDDGLRMAGYQDLRAAHAQVFVAVAADGSHLTMLAAHAGMTKQAMGELVRYLEQRGYLEIQPDLRDRRAKIIGLTAEGRRAQEVCLRLVEAGEHRLVQRFGDEGVQELRTQLRRIAEGQRP